MDWAAIVEGVSIVAGLVGAVISLWVNSTVEKRVSRALDHFQKAEVDPLRKQLFDANKAINQLENRLVSAASSEEVHRIALSVERIAGEVKVIAERATTTQATVKRIDEFLMEKA